MLVATHRPGKFCPHGEPCGGHSFLDPVKTLEQGTSVNERTMKKYGTPPEEIQELLTTIRTGLKCGMYSTLTDGKGEEWFVRTYLGHWYAKIVKVN